MERDQVVDAVRIGQSSPKLHLHVSVPISVEGVLEDLKQFIIKGAETCQLIEQTKNDGGWLAGCMQACRADYDRWTSSCPFFMADDVRVGLLRVDCAYAREHVSDSDIIYNVVCWNQHIRVQLFSIGHVYVRRTTT
jgi:hypothetical protein